MRLCLLHEIGFTKCPSAAAEIEVKSVLFAFCFTSAPLNAGTPPRGTFTGAADRRLQVWSAVRTNQPPVSDELTLLCQLILKRFFFCTVSGTFSFWQDKKKMWGTFQWAKPIWGLLPCGSKENVGDILHGKAVFPVLEAGTALCTIKARSKQPSCEMPKSMV